MCQFQQLAVRSYGPTNYWGCVRSKLPCIQSQFSCWWRLVTMCYPFIAAMLHPVTTLYTDVHTFPVPSWWQCHEININSATTQVLSLHPYGPSKFPMLGKYPGSVNYELQCIAYRHSYRSVQCSCLLRIDGHECRSTHWLLNTIWPLDTIDMFLLSQAWSLLWSSSAARKITAGCHALSL